MQKKLSGKWALVTGSSRGIGQQIALGLADHGANIIIHSREIQHAKDTVALLEPFEVEVQVVAGDLASPRAVQKVIDAVETQVGGIDILYNNAAIVHEPLSIFDQSKDLWDRVFQVNVWALIELCQAFAPGMKARGWGRITNVTSSIAGKPEFTAYSVSKAAVNKYSLELATALTGTNVLVNYVDPGWVKTATGGPDAQYPVETVLPGILVPALLEDHGPSGRFYAAQDFRVLGISSP